MTQENRGSSRLYRVLKYMNLLAALESSTTPSHALESSATPSQAPDLPATPLKQLIHDQHQDILLLHSLGGTYKKIFNHLKIIYQEVQYICELNTATSKKYISQPGQLTEKQMNEIIKFITVFKVNH
ncbi:conserved hypothetical protein [Histoplasma capsulatum H143]|uniref:Uncharacterized protein n=1 Tax=Ajellomyces capsulatus (strain H143) TaxID=544712 RepID=C6HN51_AJECH|nr:conserved hypothetical protein [Histoplasma capsulatum H143]